MKKWLILVFCLPIFLLAQEKIEVEKRIKSQEVSKQAKNFILETFADFKKIKWYKELNEDTTFHEAKFYVNKHLYSVKFFTNGDIYDIEKKIDFSNINNDTRNTINQFFTATFSSFKIRKVQVQYLGSEKDLKKLNETKENITTNYEIEIYGNKINLGKNLWEYTFDESGHYINEQQVKIHPSGNLDF